MISTLIGLFSSAGFGAVTGILGSWLTRNEERKQKKLDNDFRIEMAKINLEESKLDRQHEIDMADKQRIEAETEGSIEKDLIKMKGEVESEKADAQSFIASIRSSSKPVGIKWIDGLQKIMRVVITVYLLVIVTKFSFDVNTIVGGLGSIDASELVKLYVKIISDMLFLTMVAVGWYFGKRATNKK